MAKNKEFSNPDVWIEEQYEEYMKELYGMEFIAGYTKNGVPYGTFIGEGGGNDELIIRDIPKDISRDISRDISKDSDDELPF